MTLVEFLRARLDADEQTARDAANRHWITQDNIIELVPMEDADGFMSFPTRADARHAAAWDPARVLAEVEAKRQIMDLHHEADYDVQGERTCARCVNPDGWTVVPLPAEERWPCKTLRLLGMSFVGHDDYREGWRP